MRSLSANRGRRCESAFAFQFMHPTYTIEVRRMGVIMKTLGFRGGALGLACVLTLGVAEAAALKKRAAAPTRPSPTAFTSQREPGQAHVSSARTTGRPEIYLLRGLFNVFSLGMDELAGKLQAQGFSSAVDNHAAWGALADRIIQARASGSNSPIVLIGHSLGGDDVIKLAERLHGAGIQVDLLMPVDAVSPSAVPANVRRVVNYFQSSNGWGQPVRPGTGFRGVLVNADLETNRRELRDANTGHTTIDKSMKVHVDILREVARVRRLLAERHRKPRSASAPVAVAPPSPVVIIPPHGLRGTSPG
jgi:hypothetical protein